MNKKKMGKVSGIVLVVGFTSALLYGSPKERIFLNEPPRPVTGVRGQADLRAILRFSDLPQRPVSIDVKGTGKAPNFRPLPAKGAVPGKAAGPRQEPVAVSQPPASLFSAANTPPPIQNFLALEDNNTVIPPDVHGAAGPNHLMVTLNSQVRIQNRMGGVISTVSLDDFWSGLGNPSPFDPKVLYDPYAGRWMFTAVADAQSNSASLLMGVSQTTDPTGGWNLYRVDADPANRLFTDYPSMGFNKKWIVVNVNLFTTVGDTFIRSDNFAFNKADLYAGGNGLFTRLQDTTFGGAIAPAITYDTTEATMFLVEDWNGNFFGDGYLRLSTISGPVGAEVYSPGEAFPSTPSTWADFPPGYFVDFAPQLGSTRKIVCNDARMQNTVYRNGYLWCAHTVFLPPGTATRSSVQWWKIALDGTVSQRGRVDDAVGNRFYAFPSIAVNKNNAVLIGYSRFSAAQYASGNYAYRIASDPANTLRNDTVLKAGEASYNKDAGSGLNRWGDYTNTVIDPVNDLDMWTIQQYAALPVSGSDRWGTWWGKIGEPAVVDCNTNGIEDSIDILLGTSRDCDSSRVPDECQLPGNDTDADSILNVCDNCPAIPNPGQEDPDGDGRGSPCDNCPLLVNARGDMNGMGGLSPADAVLHLNCTFLGIGSCDVCFSDMNCDAQLAPADAVYELNAIFLGSPISCTP